MRMARSLSPIRSSKRCISRLAGKYRVNRPCDAGPLEERAFGHGQQHVSCHSGGQNPSAAVRLSSAPKLLLAMPELKDELDPPFEILEPAQWCGPVIFNSPHSGNVYPRAFLMASQLELA